MKSYYIYSVVVSILFCGCANNEKGTGFISSSSCELSGKYLNKNILDKCPDPMPVDIPYYALELSFKGSDTVEIVNGIEKYHLPFEKTDKKCTYKIAGASQFGEMYFTVFGDSTIELLDTAWTKVNTGTTFQKTRSATKADWGFENFFNECVIAGTYSFTKTDGQRIPVYFLQHGQVSGLKPYLSYTLCYAGDCLEETSEKTTLIEFFTDKGQKELFALKMPEGKSRIQFYKIGDPIPDQKGGRAIGDLAFEITAQQVN